MMVVTIVYILLIAHFVGDFLFQTNWMATNKGSSMRALFVHVATYTASVLSIAGMGLLFVYKDAAFVYLNMLLAWTALNALLHFGTDFITARLSGAALEQDNTRAFWLIIGADQLLHMLTLVSTWTLVSKWSLG